MSPRNLTLDDASSSITYNGWTSSDSASAPLEAIRSGSFYADTVSYTGTASATSSFDFVGQLLYIYGCTGPSFGSFEIRMDGVSRGTYNATAGANTFGTLLWFGQLEGDGAHRAQVTNMVDGKKLALDYFVATTASPGGGSDWSEGGGPPTSPNPSPTVAVGPAPTASFPTGGAQADGTGDSSNSEVIGGILGTLAGLVSSACRSSSPGPLAGGIRGLRLC